MIRWKLAPLAIGLPVLGVLFTTTGCGSSTAHTRLMNAMSGISRIDMLLDNKSTVSGTTYGAASGYVTSDSGSRSLLVEATGSSSPLINQTVSFTSGSDSTVLATWSGAIVFADNNSAPSSGNIKIRVINASPTLGTADVYIVASELL